MQTDYAYECGRLRDQRRELLRRLDDLLAVVPYPNNDPVISNARRTSAIIHAEIKRETGNE